VKGDIHEIWRAETKEDTKRAFDAFIEKYNTSTRKRVNISEKTES